MMKMLLAFVLALIFVTSASAQRLPGPPIMAPRAIPDPIRGITLDDTTNVNDSVAALGALDQTPTARVVFDRDTAPPDYLGAVSTYWPISYIMGLPVDSYDMARYSWQQHHDRFAQFLASGLAQYIDIWEIGNEVNGNWTGNYDAVAAKIYDAWQQVSAAGGVSLLTLWYNPGCAGSSGELDPITFSQQYIPPDMAAGMSYVMLSYYETECNNYRPDAATLTDVFTQLSTIFPNAKLGFGEVGLPQALTGQTYDTGVSIAGYYYGLSISVPGYTGGYFWWYGYEDAIPYTKPFWSVLNAALNSE